LTIVHFKADEVEIRSGRQAALGPLEAVSTIDGN
jgi:hypothetical protein